ncbi:hypothetical protein [Knoellia sp. LjRoot47]|uniref:hypothetical protein n=1 Tax=Knoellia sp. LjRoot47 TaxID=3342330 RepID=UPI003ECE7BEE
MNSTSLATRTGLAVLALTAAVSLSACSGGDIPESPTPSASVTTGTTPTTPVVSTAPSPTANPSPTTVPTDDVPAAVQAAFPGGQAPSWKDGVAAAYRALDIALGVQDTLTGANPESNYEPVRPLLTPERWARLAAEADKGDPDNIAGGLVPTVATGAHAGTLVVDGGRRVVPTGLARGPQYGPAAVGLQADDTNTALTVRVPVTATYSTADGPATRHTDVTLALVPVGDGWLVSGWLTTRTR